MQSDIKNSIKERYGATAQQADKTGEGAREVAQAFGYSKEDLEAIPQEANMGLSCGTPLALANLKDGEVVVDLGSGGGLDCFLAAKKVGDSGRVIGVDMTPSMIELATANAKKFGKDNIEFRLGDIEAIPVEDNTADCVISNCVINLSVDKQQVFNEIHRVLKPGGRLAVSDLCLKQELPAPLKESIMAYVGCVAGALHVGQYRDMMEKAGFSDITLVPTDSDLNAYTKLVSDGAPCCASVSMPKIVETVKSNCCAKRGCCGGGEDVASAISGVLDLLRHYNVNDFVGSYKIFAVKPQRSKNVDGDKRTPTAQKGGCCGIWG